MAGTLPRPAVVAIITFTVGAAALGTEIAAARLLAPWFGASTIVWANTIATVLLALSAGYWLGGRLAERWPGLYGLCLVTLAAAVLLAVVPFVARPFLRASADALDDVSAGVFVGSLLGVCVLVAAPCSRSAWSPPTRSASASRVPRARAASADGCTPSRPSEAWSAPSPRRWGSSPCSAPGARSWSSRWPWRLPRAWGCRCGRWWPRPRSRRECSCRRGRSRPRTARG